MLFDSHSHLHLSQFDGDREEIIKKLRDFDIKTINIGTDFEESKKAVELAKKYPDLLWASVGLHPTDNSTEELDINKYRELAKGEKVVAIGECGLDYFRIKGKPAPEGRGSLNEIERQKEIFIKQIELAKELNKPLILHCRPSIGSQDAYGDAFNILNSYFAIRNSNLDGVVHFFSGSRKTAKNFLDLGFYISFAGPITFHPTRLAEALAERAGDHPKGGANPYEELVKFVPLDRILVETDSPFAAPLPYRGKRNEPAYVEFVARQIAEWKNLKFEEIAKQASENTKGLFNINF